MDALTDGVRASTRLHDVLDGIVLCGFKEVDMTEYLNTSRKSLEEKEG